MEYRSRTSLVTSVGLVIYRVRSSKARIPEVDHHRRDLGYWKGLRKPDFVASGQSGTFLIPTSYKR